MCFSELKVVLVCMLELIESLLVFISGPIQNVSFFENRVVDIFNVRFKIHHFISYGGLFVMVTKSLVYFEILLFELVAKSSDLAYHMFIQEFLHIFRYVYEFFHHSP